MPRLAVCKPVFFTAAALLVLFVAFGVLATETTAQVFAAALAVIAGKLGWFYVFSIAGFVLFAAWLAASRHGRLVLGKDGEKPEFSRITWFSMLFSAGMGIGLLFYGVAEPVMHYAHPPQGQGGTLEAARQALPLTFLHWGIHAWSIYVILGLGIAYFAFRRDLPLSLRSVLHPLLGRRIHGVAGHTVDILAVLGTLVGLATSLGLGAMQINAGLSYLTRLPQSIAVQLVLIAVITCAATLSLVSGVNRGIRRLSELNMLLAGVLLLFVLLVGPTGHLVRSFFVNLANYAVGFVPRSFAAASPSAGKWHQDWTLYYWGWWISWSPFVGMFVARISRGRTVREFILGVVLIPTLVTFIWMTVFGDTALWLERQGGDIAAAVSQSVPTAIFVMLGELPLAKLTSALAACVVAVFFVTSSDSASFVVDMITSGGHPSPPRWQRVFWALAEGAVAAVLLDVGGRKSLKGLQAAVICVGLPFCLVLVLTCVSLMRALRQDRASRPE